MSDDATRKETLTGPARPGATRAGAATVVPTGSGQPPADVPAPITNLPAAPEGTPVPRHIIRVPGRPELDLAYYAEGATRLPTRKEMDDKAAEVRDKLRAQAANEEAARAEAAVAHTTQGSRSWLAITVVIILSVPMYGLLAWVLFRPFF